MAHRIGFMEGDNADPKVAYGINPVASGMMLDSQPQKEIGMTLRKSPGGENGLVMIREVSPQTAKEPTVAIATLLSQMRYIVRRLTPKECMRLMGLPDDYAVPVGLRRFFGADGEPSPELVSEFVDIFDKYNAIMAEYEHKKPPKGKSYNQVAAWLKKISNPATCPDSPVYKACGNGMCTNQPRWILTRLLAKEGVEW